MQTTESTPILASDDATWPAEVRLIISALEAADYRDANGERRVTDRAAYRTIAQLQLFSDPEGSGPWQIYCRDVNHRALGFLVSTRLPLGHGGVVSVKVPDGRTLELNCTLLRCREAVNGWFEAAVYFNRDQPVFAVKDTDPSPSSV